MPKRACDDVGVMRRTLTAKPLNTRELATFLEIVAKDEPDIPICLKVLISVAGQSVNLHPAVWYMVLARIVNASQIVVVDRVAEGENLKEHWFNTPYVVEWPNRTPTYRDFAGSERRQTRLE